MHVSRTELMARASDAQDTLEASRTDACIPCRSGRVTPVIMYVAGKIVRGEINPSQAPEAVSAKLAENCPGFSETCMYGQICVAAEAEIQDVA